MSYHLSADGGGSRAWALMPASREAVSPDKVEPLVLSIVYHAKIQIASNAYPKSNTRMKVERAGLLREIYKQYVFKKRVVFFSAGSQEFLLSVKVAETTEIKWSLDYVCHVSKGIKSPPAPPYDPVAPVSVIIVASNRLMVRSVRKHDRPPQKNSDRRSPLLPPSRLAPARLHLPCCSKWGVP